MDVDLKICPCCGFSLSDFEKIKRLGCSKCYSTFQKEVDLFLKEIRQGESHQGKVIELSLDKKRLKLNALLKEAISKRRYEEAAEIEKQLQNLH